MITTKITNILPIGNSYTALVSIEEITLDNVRVMSVVCRNWKDLAVGDTVSVKSVAGFPTIIFTDRIIITGEDE